MAKYRSALPQLAGDFFMTDGGIETTLNFLEGQDLPLFAAFPLLESAEGEGVLRRYFVTYAELVRKFGTGLILEAATWRASPEWGREAGLRQGRARGSEREGRAPDEATAGYPAYYMINCTHPSHFDRVVDGDAPWLSRIRGRRANASRMSHAELNDAPELDPRSPPEVGREYADLRRRQLKHLNVMGGCCGTDHRHIEHIASACRPLFR